MPDGLLADVRQQRAVELEDRSLGRVGLLVEVETEHGGVDAQDQRPVGVGAPPNAHIGHAAFLSDEPVRGLRIYLPPGG